MCHFWHLLHLELLLRHFYPLMQEAAWCIQWGVKGIRKCSCCMGFGEVLWFFLCLVLFTLFPLYFFHQNNVKTSLESALALVIKVE